MVLRVRCLVYLFLTFKRHEIYFILHINLTFHKYDNLKTYLHPSSYLEVHCWNQRNCISVKPLVYTSLPIIYYITCNIIYLGTSVLGRAGTTLKQGVVFISSLFLFISCNLYLYLLVKQLYTCQQYLLSYIIVL